MSILSISARALKLAGTTLAPSLCGLFNQSITSATLPREWKSANITPVHKGGDEANRHDKTAKERLFKVGDQIYVRNFASGAKWLPGVITTV